MQDIHNKSLDTILKTVDIQQGLSQDEAKSRLVKNGPNKLAEAKKRPFILKFIDQFKDVTIIILLIATVISFFIGETVDAIVILAIVIINAILGLYQEGKAENALAALQKLSAPSSKVIRNHLEQVIPSEELVIGDIIVLEAGDLVSADVRLLKTSSLQIEEASLTGESVPVDKDSQVVVEVNAPLGDRVNMAFSSGNVTYGRGIGVVVATGMDTEVGKIASILNETKNDGTPLQRQLNDLGKVLGMVAIIAVIILFLYGTLINQKEPMAMFMTAISLAVAVVPESLPTVSTIVLSMGVQRLVTKKAIIRTLPSVETLGSTTVICSDKTGTLTQNKMTVVETWESDNEQFELTLLLCNDARRDDQGQWIGDPTETAMSRYIVEKDNRANHNLRIYQRIGDVPFDSKRKRMTTINQIEDNTMAFIKGGVDEVLAVCTHINENGTIRLLNDNDIKTIQSQNKTMASKALRVLATASKVMNEPFIDGDKAIEADFAFSGLVGLIDPPRPEVKVAIQECHQAGIRVVMITGDHAITASAIGEEIGLLDENTVTVTGVELDSMSDEELFNKVKHIGVYARVSPEHKMRIIDAWKKHGEIVAMTGDGVNDAPALKKADIGAAMGIVGTEVAKSASDMILTDDNFATVVSAVEEGRRIRDNIKKAVSYLLSCNMGELFSLLLATLLNWPMPLLAIHILWINLVTDSLPALALGVDPAEEGIMQRQPDRTNSLFTKQMAWRTLYQGIVIGCLTIVAFCIGNGWLFINQGSVELGQTMAFAVLGFSQLAHSLNIHSPHASVFKTMFANKSLLLAITINMLMMFAVLLIAPIQEIFKLVSLDAIHWACVIILSIMPWLVVELMKKLKLNGND